MYFCKVKKLAFDKIDNIWYWGIFNKPGRYEGNDRSSGLNFPIIPSYKLLKIFYGWFF